MVIARFATLTSLALCPMLVLLPSTAAGTAPGSCSAAAYHAMDFTIGRWAVRVPGSTSPATSDVQFDVRGCAVVERWSGQTDSGMNVDAYNAEDGHWHRFFVDAYGKVHVFAGSADGRTVRYEGQSTGENGQRTRSRLTIFKRGPNTFDQLWEKSVDGKTWSVAFKGVYTRIVP